MESMNDCICCDVSECCDKLPEVLAKVSELREALREIQHKPEHSYIIAYEALNFGKESVQ
jgi:hypothetical protein